VGQEGIFIAGGEQSVWLKNPKDKMGKVNIGGKVVRFLNNNSSGDRCWPSGGENQGGKKGGTTRPKNMRTEGGEKKECTPSVQSDSSEKQNG